MQYIPQIMNTASLNKWRIVIPSASLLYEVHTVIFSPTGMQYLYIFSKTVRNPYIEVIWRNSASSVDFFIIILCVK